MLKFFLIFPFISSKLLFVHLHFRHGTRGPCDHLDTNNKDLLGIHWETLGELHSVGIRQSYILGYLNHLKYKNFINDYFDPREIYIISTDFNRTINSALSFMHGMFNKGLILKNNQIKNAVPPLNLSNETLNEIINLRNFALPNQIQTFPIHIFNTLDHFTLLYESIGGCKGIKNIREQINSQKFIYDLSINFNNTYGEKLLKFLKKENEFNLFTNFNYILVFCDHFISDKITMKDINRINELKNYNIDFNEFTKSCNNILQTQLFNVTFGNEIIIKMSQSPSMRQLIKYFEGRINLNEKNISNLLDYDYPKFVIYSAHDSTIAGIEKFMNLVFGSKLINPVHSSNLYFELHFENNKYIVRYIINDEITEEFEFDVFKKKIDKYLWSDKEIEDFCQFSYKKVKDGSYYLYYENILFYIIIFLILVVFSLGILILYFKSKNNYKKK